MSDERLAEIRAMALAPWCKECDAVADLLSEVDRLRAEVDRLRKVISDAARYSTPHTQVSSASTVAYVGPIRGW